MNRSAWNRAGVALDEQNPEIFDRWSRSYDMQHNPLLLLERRFLAELLPDVAGRDVLDVGCGSGRWLAQLAEMQPHSLCGIDSSARMLEEASKRDLKGVELFRASCLSTPLSSHRFDLILASFSLSYVSDLQAFVAEMDRVARSTSEIFVTDMHPGTQMRLGWKRTFQDGGETVELPSFVHRIEEIVAAFSAHGWQQTTLLEPCFGDAERGVFAAAGRANRFEEARRYPAIYILHLTKGGSRGVPNRTAAEITLRGGRCAFGPEESADADLEIAEGRILRIGPAAEAHSGTTELDLSGYLIIPGLINAHDHLEFALFPRLAGSRYANASDWARDIHIRFSELIAKQRAVPREMRLWWGTIRNLVCGVTTVSHHNPVDGEFERDDFPVRVVRDFGWGHSLSFGGDLAAARSATPAGSPFIVHACEGIDEHARGEIRELDRMGILDRNCVLVHGLALDEAGARLARERGAAFILCPSSNQFLFGAVPGKGLIDCRAALGSDSPLTAAGDLLDEARFAIDHCGVAAGRAYRMITKAPAEILRLREGEGAIRTCGTADLVAIRDTGQEPSERLRSLSAADVDLVVVRGRVHLASPAMLDRLPASMRESLEPLCIDGTVRWLRAPVRELLRAAESVLGAGAVRLGGTPVSLPLYRDDKDLCFPRSQKRDLHPTDEDLSMGTPDLEYPSFAVEEKVDKNAY